MSMSRSQRLFIVSTAILVVCALGSDRATAQFIITEIIDRTGSGGQAGNRLGFPTGIAVDAAGNAYVVGSSTDNAFKITPAGVITKIIFRTGDGAGNGLDVPFGIAVDAAGNVYVTGWFSDNAFKITPAGVITEIIDGTGDGAGNGLNGPQGIAVDAAGNVYVTGSNSDNAFKITPAGVITEIIDATGDGAGNGLDLAQGIAVDGAGNVYVAGFSSSNAFKITPAGVITQIIDATGDGTGNDLRSPRDIALDTTGNAYVSVVFSDNAFKITPAGVVTQIIDTNGDGAGNGLENPRSVAVDAAGNVYVAGAHTDNVFKITPAGAITQIIDSTGDGVGNGFSSPRDIAVDAAGNVYVTGVESNNAFQITPVGLLDCNNNGIPDATDIANGTSQDCNANGIPDDCEVLGFTQQAKLVAGDAADDDQFGSSVSISGDTAIIGAVTDNDAGAESGSAYVFVRTGSVWTQQAKITATDAAAFDLFGRSVSISGDTAVIGALGDDGAGSKSGSAYVFVRTGTVWTQQAKITAGDGAALDFFGASVSICGDTVVIGARLDDDAGADSGSAYVFVRTGTVWTQQAKITATDATAFDNFGFSVSISGDTVVIGSSRDDDAGSSSGSAYVFVRRGGIWTQQAKLIAADGAAFEFFGESVSISSDTAVIGLWRDDDAGNRSGSAYVFVRTGTVWSQQAKLTAADAAALDRFGFSVSISGDTAVIGSTRDDDAGDLSGSAYVFALMGGVWTQQAKLTAADAAAGDLFGNSVSISGDTAVIGVQFDDDAGNRSGSAYVFTRSTDCNSNGIPDDCDIANGTSPDCNANGIPDECEEAVLNLDLDIKPGGCPNAFNSNSHGVLPVALLGAADFDITTVDVSSVRLSRADGIGGAVAPNEGPPGPHSVFEDVATPFAGQTCDCHDLTGDGILDLSMKFRTDAVVAALGLNDLSAGALVELALRGCLLDGTAFSASDCLRLVPPDTASGVLAVQSSEAGAWIDVGPLDNTLDGGGFADFQRNYFMGTVVTLTAPRFAAGRLFTGWLIDGAAPGAPGGRSIDLTVSGETSALATYVDLALGDVNQDGTVDGRDIQGFVDVIVAPAGAGDLDRILADLNGDNQVDLADATQLVQLLLGPA